MSVVIPSYNHESYIAEAMISVFGQVYNKWEMIIVDDCSQDGTYEKIINCSAAYNGPNRITVQRNEVNRGICKTLNRALTYCSGEYLCILASDDRYMTNKLLDQVKILDSITDLSGVFGLICLIDNFGHTVSKPQESSRVVRGDNLHRKILFSEEFPPIGGGLFRTDKVLEVGAFDESYSSEDLSFILRLTRSNAVALFEKCVYEYRGFVANSASKCLDGLPGELIAITEKELIEAQVTRRDRRKVMAALYNKISEIFLNYNRRVDAKYYAFYSIMSNPLHLRGYRSLVKCYLSDSLARRLRAVRRYLSTL